MYIKNKSYTDTETLYTTNVNENQLISNVGKAAVCLQPFVCHSATAVIDKI